MRHLKLFENTKNNTLWNFLKEKNRIYDLIKDFVMEFKSDMPPLYSPRSVIGDFEIKKVIRIDYYTEYRSPKWPGSMKIWLQDHREHVDIEIQLEENDIKELFKFIEDPDLYRNAKKYNL